MADTITLGFLVQRCKRWLVGLHGQPLNRLQDAIDADVTEIVCSYSLAQLTTNTYVGIDDEIVYVWEANTGTKTLQVSRAQMGTEAAAHAQSAVIETMARYPQIAIKEALQEEIRSWPDNLYKVQSKHLEAAANQGALDLGVKDSALRRVLAVDRAPIPGQHRWSKVRYRVDRGMPRDVVPSGVLLNLDSLSPSAGAVRVLVGRDFTTDDLDDSTDMVEDWGLARSMCDIPPMGVASRLIQAAELQRAETEALGESRIPAEVPATYRTQTAAALWRLRNQRLGEEANRLSAKYQAGK